MKRFLQFMKEEAAAVCSAGAGHIAGMGLKANPEGGDGVVDPAGPGVPKKRMGKTRVIKRALPNGDPQGKS